MTSETSVNCNNFIGIIKIKLKQLFFIISIVCLVWAIFTFNHDVKQDISITRPSNTTTPIENTYPFPATTSMINQPAVEDVVHELKMPSKWHIRDAEAKKAIKSCADDNIKPGIVRWNIPEDEILEELEHSDPGNRINAIHNLHQLYQSESIALLREILLQDEDTDVRREAITVLASIEGEEAFTALETALGDEDSSVRYHVIQALAETGSKSIPLLGQVLFSEQDPELRRLAVELITFQEEPAAQALISIALQDPDEYVRQQAKVWDFEPEMATTTGSNNYPTHGAAAEFAPNNQFFEEFMALDPEDQTVSIYELYEFDPKDAVPILNSLLPMLVDINVRREAISVLASIEGEEAFTALATALGDEDTSVRYHVIQTLGEAGSKSIPLLGQVLFSEKDPELRRLAFELIASQEEPAAQALMYIAIQELDNGVSLTDSQFSY